jgi:hypothetical protein
MVGVEIASQPGSAFGKRYGDQKRKYPSSRGVPIS